MGTASPLALTYTAAISWTQSSSILSLTFDFISIGSWGALWMNNHSPGELLLCTHWHVDEFFLSAITLSPARQCYVCPMIADSPLLAKLFVLILFGFTMLVNYTLSGCFFFHHLLVQGDGWIPADCQIFFGFSILAGPSHQNMESDFHGIT